MSLAAPDPTGDRPLLSGVGQQDQGVPGPSPGEAVAGQAGGGSALSLMQSSLILVGPGPSSGPDKLRRLSRGPTP